MERSSRRSANTAGNKKQIEKLLDNVSVKTTFAKDPHARAR